MRFVLVFFSLLAFGGNARATVYDSLRAEQRAEGLFVVHQVEEEETLYSIARRYGGSIQKIIEHNNIVDNTIDIGQIIDVLVVNDMQALNTAPVALPDGVHSVGKGETLYSISRLYKLKVKELKKWNNLKGNDISLGMLLKVAKDSKLPAMNDSLSADRTQKDESIEMTSDDSVKTESPDLFEGFEQYLVQTGETLYSIAQKIGVRMDSLQLWNGLTTESLDVGQALRFKEQKDAAVEEDSAESKTALSEDGFERVYEEGVASVIEAMNTSKYLALHRHLPIGTNIEVKNLMNGQLVHVKVVGKLPNTGLNKKLIVRLSKAAYDQLGILDSKARVEVSYFKTQ